jgi:hypothetical protein
MSAFWRNWLMVWCVGVLVFGLVLAGGAFDATSGPVRLIYLQGPEDLVLDPAMRFTLAVMGCVSIGWAVTMFLMIRAARLLGAQARPIWMGLTVGVVVWFVTDSALSIATGYGLNVVPNMFLMVTYIVAILASGALKPGLAPRNK